ncbi:MAG: HAMP domain-containing sensor histidine kinase [Marinilabiliaceae bacterium]|jgi:signal transduction histidine kinase|nr:HAMP domain-containing sensor histidine kinase [Marinilabiliaceae bacterium]
MTLPDKNRTIGLLMLVSQILLTAFAFYWLAGQYTKEKRDLWSDLKEKYYFSYRTTVDSFLVKHYIEPVLGDTTINYYRYAKPARALVMSDSFMIDTRGVTKGGIRTGEGIVTINLSAREDTTGQFTISEAENFEHEMLLQSVRLILERTDDSSRIHLNSLHGINRGVDTILFVSTFESQLKAADLKIKPVWVSQEIDSASTRSRGRILIGGWINDMPQVEFKGYSLYLLGRISPQILFVFILILMVGSAFLLAFRSLVKQTQLNEMRSSFISNISHELKTPVSTVKVAIEALRNFDFRKDPEKVRNYLAMSSKELKRLELLITKVLDNSIIEQDSSILRFETADLSEVINAAIDSLTPKIHDAKAKVRFSPESSMYVKADPLYLQGVIINLIDNSIKYGNGNPEIDIVLYGDKDNAVIKVADKGPGIPEQYLKKVFDKFFRIPTSNTHNVKGYGLGLSFAFLIVEMHGGSISVANNERGCTFTIVIPITQVED